jgi:hypothetical protein
VTLFIQRVTPNFFSLLGLAAPPALAANLSASAAQEPIFVALTTSGSRTLSPERTAVGTELLDKRGRTVRIVARLPDDFLFPDRAQRRVSAVAFFEPSRILQAQGCCEVTALLRLRPGVTLDAVRSGFSRTLSSGRVLDVTVWRVVDELRGEYRALAVGAMTASGLLLLICTGNVANLWVARNTTRWRECATRRTLGASRFDLWRLCAIEVALAMFVAAGLGVAIGWLALKLVGPVIPAPHPLLGVPSLTLRSVTFSAGRFDDDASSCHPRGTRVWNSGRNRWNARATARKGVSSRLRWRASGIDGGSRCRGRVAGAVLRETDHERCWL